MEKSNQLLYFIGLVLVMATCMTGSIMNQSSKRSSKNLRDTLCVTGTVKNHACHTEHCHDGSVHIRGCDVWKGGNCDNFTLHYDVYNSSRWRNTTCELYACEIDVSTNCYNVNLTYNSCTNGDCRNGINYMDICYTISPAMNALYIPNTLGDVFDIPCLNLLFNTYRRSRLDTSE